MDEKSDRIIPVSAGKVACLPGREETVEHCRFCVHSRYFLIDGEYVLSPALAYCMLHRATEKIDLNKVKAVKCGDHRHEGFRSIMNVIS